MSRIFPFVALALFAMASAAAAQSGDNVLLVVNESSAESGRIAERYARTRSVPQSQIVRIKVDAAADEVARKVFEDQIQTPISDWLRANSAQDRILYIVLTKGIPLRVQGTAGRAGTVASVDSELTLLYRRLAGSDVTSVGSLPNPYYVGDGDVARARPFSHQNSDIYLVTRLDGFTVDDVLGLIKRGAAPARGGKIILDQKGGFGDVGGDAWLKAAADWMTANGLGDRVMLETTSRPVGKETGVLGYYSWGSSDPAATTRHVEIAFEPGAIAAMFVSSDARTFKEPPPDWKIGSWTDRAKFFAGSPQSLSGDLIRDGVTGVAGHVAEPYLDATIRPDILFPAYLSGFNLAESYYLAMPYLSWQTVVGGDPLCAPSPRKALQPSDIDKGIDPATELPALILAQKAPGTDSVRYRHRRSAAAAARRRAQGERRRGRCAEGTRGSHGARRSTDRGSSAAGRDLRVEQGLRQGDREVPEGPRSGAVQHDRAQQPGLLPRRAQRPAGGGHRLRGARLHAVEERARRRGHARLDSAPAGTRQGGSPTAGAGRSGTSSERGREAARCGGVCGGWHAGRGCA